MLITSSKQLAIHLRDERKNKNLSQTKVADPVGLKQDTISKFEINPETTRVQTLFRILSSLNLEMHIVQKGENIDLKVDDGDEKWWVKPWRFCALLVRPKNTNQSKLHQRGLMLYMLQTRRLKSRLGEMNSVYSAPFTSLHSTYQKSPEQIAWSSLGQRVTASFALGALRYYS